MKIILTPREESLLALANEIAEVTYGERFAVIVEPMPGKDGSPFGHRATLLSAGGNTIETADGATGGDALRKEIYAIARTLLLRTD